MKHVLEECKRKQGTRRVGVANHLLQAETQLKRKHHSQREKKKKNLEKQTPNLNQPLPSLFFYPSYFFFLFLFDISLNKQNAKNWGFSCLKKSLESKNQVISNTHASQAYSYPRLKTDTDIFIHMYESQYLHVSAKRVTMQVLGLENLAKNLLSFQN